MRRLTPLLIAGVLLTAALSNAAPLSPSKRLAFIIESWYPASHADVIGRRLLEGFRVNGVWHDSPVTITTVYAEAPRPTDQTAVLSRRYGFRVANSVRDAMLGSASGGHPRLAVDGIFVSTREDLPRQGGEPPSPTRRLQLIQEVFRVLDETGRRVPIFLDKMPSANWADNLSIAAEARRRGIPIMAGSVLGFMPLDRQIKSGGVSVAVVIAGGPFRAYGFHAAELLQAFMERRATREVGVSRVAEVGASYWLLPDREAWGAKVFDALLSGRGRGGRGESPLGDPYVLLIQYGDGTRAVLATMPRVIPESEFLLGALYRDGTVETGGVALRSEPFDHFGYLAKALVELYATGLPPVPLERSLLSTGIVLHGLQHRQGSPLPVKTLEIIYQAPIK